MSERGVWDPEAEAENDADVASLDSEYPEARRTPIVTRLFRSDIEAWDDSLRD
jgi:hypothetical protein